MTDTLPRVSIKELAYKIKGYGSPRFAFFLGAGASRQSGIITAGEMINDFAERLTAQGCPDDLKSDEEKKGWLSEQEWYKEEKSRYCKLFEKLEPMERGRQRYIESIIRDKEPSFGYVVLAYLIENGYINTVVTTNFDNLVYSACTTYTGKQPVVYAYGLMASEMRISAQRPIVLKLHGDFLYSRIKNTVGETAEQDPNMEHQFRQILNEYGLIVVGYSGGDDSVMKVLSHISEENDLYWCIRRGDKLNAPVIDLLTRKRGFIVEIKGFDEMMSEVLSVVEFDVQKMIGSIEQRRAQLVEHLKKFAPQYSAKIISNVVEAINEPAMSEGENKKLQAANYFSQAYEASMAEDYVKAETLYFKAIELDPDYASAHYNLGVLLDYTARPAEAEAAYRKTIELNPNDSEAYNNLGVLLKKTGRLVEAEAAYRKSIEFNPDNSEAYNNLGNVLKNTARLVEAEAAYRKAIELNPGNFEAYNNLGILFKNTARLVEAEAAYRKSIELNPEHPDSYYNLSLLLRSQSRETEALTLAKRVLELTPQSLVAILNLAGMHKSLGQKTESNQYAAQARQLMKPDDWYNLACMESVCDNVDAAIENLKRAAQKDSFNRNWARHDPDFQWIRDDPRFKEIVGEDDA